MNDRKLTLTSILVCGGLLVTLSMGIRHGFGLFNLPITQTHGWNRETFAFALALQNLMWAPASRSPARWPTSLARCASC